MTELNQRVHFIAILKDFKHTLVQGYPFNAEHIPEEDQSFLQQLNDILAKAEAGDAEHIYLGQHWVSRLYGNYPGFAPYFNRDALWYLGGEAMHWLSDEEIAHYQQITDNEVLH